MGLLKVLFIVTILVLFPLGQIARFDLGRGVAFTSLDIGVFLCGILFVLRHVFLRSFPKSALVSPLAIFLVICLISLVLNYSWLGGSYFFVSCLYLLRFFIYSLIYLAVVNFDLDFKNRMLYFLWISGVVILAGGFAQYFFYPYLRNLYYLGWDPHLYRMFSSFLDPNFLGIFLVLYIAFLLGLAICFKNKWRVAVIFTITFAFLAVFLTYSRGALLMLAACGLSLIFLYKVQKKILVIASSTILVVLFFVFILNKTSEGTNLLRINSTNARFGSIENAWIVFTKQPIFGVGFNSYRYALRRYNLNKRANWETSHADSGSDNSLLFVLATTGIIGFIAYCYLWFVILSRVWKNRHKRTLNLVVLSSGLGLFTSSFFINSLFYPSLMFWVWIIIGLTESNLP